MFQRRYDPGRGRYDPLADDIVALSFQQKNVFEPSKPSIYFRTPPADALGTLLYSPRKKTTTSNAPRHSKVLLAFRSCIAEGTAEKLFDSLVAHSA